MNYHELAYYTGNNGNDGYKNKALELYKEATEIANECLNPAHPVRLYIAWNFSNFYIQVDDKIKSYEIAKEAYKKGLHCLPNLIESLKGPAESELEYLKEYFSCN